MQLTQMKSSYRTSDMILRIHSDASYLSWLMACRRSGVHLYMESQNLKIKKKTNSVMYTVSSIMKNMMGSSVEEEFGALFHNCYKSEPICTTLNNMGHPQPVTPTKIDNSSANGIYNYTFCKKAQKTRTCTSIGFSI